MANGVLRRLTRFIWTLRDSFWFIPALALAAGGLLGITLVESGAYVQMDLAERWPRLFGAGAAGARSTLAAIASSMITVAGVVFSVTIVALSSAASAYSPRVLRTFMHDRPTQAAFGVFVGTFVYCLVVLRTVRGGEEGAFVPSLAVFGALVLALVGACVLVYFIHHVALAIQVSTIIERVAAETREAIDSIFPEALGEGEDDGTLTLPRREGWRAIPACRSGYLVGLDAEGLLAFARERNALVRMEVAVGEFAIESQPLVSISGAPPHEDDAAAIDSLYTMAGERSIEQDAGFGVQQIVDIAVRALSPGVNDPTTARTCIVHLTALLVRLARRRMPSPLRKDAEGEPRVIARGPTFESLVTIAFAPLVQYAHGKPDVTAVLEHAARTLERAATPARKRSLRKYIEALEDERLPHAA